MSARNENSPWERLGPWDLLLDPHNPRLSEIQLPDDPSQEDLLAALWDKLNVDEVAMSIATVGYLDYEPLLVAEEAAGLVVIEGNRRLAAVRLLLDEELRKQLRATDLPAISDEIREQLQTLPVVRRTRAEAWQYLGYKHVNGPAPWGSLAKAEYISRVHREYGVSLTELAQQIGDRHLTTRRLYRAIRVLEQAEEDGVYNRHNRYGKNFGFSHLYTGLGYVGFQHHLGVADESEEASRPVPDDHAEELGEVLRWLYGDAASQTPPVVKSQNPDLRRLAAVLDNGDAVDALRAGVPLNLAHDVSLGEAKLFRDALHSAKEQLQRALATVATGHSGERGERELAYDLVELANELADRVDRYSRKRRTRSRPEELADDDR